jgi:alpha-galactosidase
LQHDIEFVGDRVTCDSVIPERPDAVIVLSAAGRPEPAAASGNTFQTADTEIALIESPDGLAVEIRCPAADLSQIVLRWRRSNPPGALILGDAWERGYGDLQWRSIQPDRVLPWYFLAHDPASGRTAGMGVRVRPSAFCRWRVTADAVELWLDLRNGGGPVRLGDRTIPAATIVTIDGDDAPFAAQQRFMAMLGPAAMQSVGPIVGCNNWYYAYGRDFTPAHILRDAETVVGLANGHPVRPYAVVDAGWSPGGVCPGGPWDRGLPGLFDDMAGLASDIAATGARPGIWIRPTALSTVDDPRRLRPGPNNTPEQALDLTLPDNLETIRADVERVRSWGFELIKHDFSTFDFFGRFGDTMGADLTEPGWSWADRSLTNAEIILRLYRILREAAGDAVVIGCNTVGHLAAGLVDVQRIGDDTSGREWKRTRKMGVNTLAFRLAQHNTFFAADADCVPATPVTPWAKNRQFLDLVARSGTALFVSVDPAARNRAVDADLTAALRIALDGGESGGVEPLDWLTTVTPNRWRIGTDERTYDWGEPADA